MRAAVFAIITALAVILQGTVLTVHPAGLGVFDLVLVVTVLLSVLNGPSTGATLGLLSGLLEDAAFGRPLGLTSMSRMPICFAAGYLESRVFRESFVMPAFAVFVATLLDRELMSVLVTMIGVSGEALTGLTARGFAGAAVNTAVALLLYAPLSRFHRPLPRGRSPRRP